MTTTKHFCHLLGLATKKGIATRVVESTVTSLETEFAEGSDWTENMTSGFVPAHPNCSALQYYSRTIILCTVACGVVIVA